MGGVCTVERRCVSARDCCVASMDGRPIAKLALELRPLLPVSSKWRAVRSGVRLWASSSRLHDRAPLVKRWELRDQGGHIAQLGRRDRPRRCQQLDVRKRCLRHGGVADTVDDCKGGPTLQFQVVLGCSPEGYFARYFMPAVFLSINFFGRNFLIGGKSLVDR